MKKSLLLIVLLGLASNALANSWTVKAGEYWKSAVSLSSKGWEKTSPYAHSAWTHIGPAREYVWGKMTDHKRVSVSVVSVLGLYLTYKASLVKTIKDHKKVSGSTVIGAGIYTAYRYGALGKIKALIVKK